MVASTHPVFARLGPQLDRARDEIRKLAALHARATTLADDAVMAWAVIVARASAVETIYSGMEEILKSLAANIDGSVPEGREWHRQLLDQMSVSLPNVRPAVLSSDLSRQLSELLSFRHVVRHRYGMELDPARVAAMAEKTVAVFSTFERAMTALEAALSQPHDRNEEQPGATDRPKPEDR